MEPIAVGGTIGVVSMAARVLPAIEAVTLAHAADPAALAGGSLATAKANPGGERGGTFC